MIFVLIKVFTLFMGIVVIVMVIMSVLIDAWPVRFVIVFVK